jgi:hypothetical protein
MSKRAMAQSGVSKLFGSDLLDRYGADSFQQKLETELVEPVSRIITKR